MAKRKSADDAPLPHKKAKLHQVIHDGHISDIHTLHSPYSPPLSLTSPERRKKRKRTPDPQSDTFKKPETKRARRSPSESPHPGLEPWPSIGCNPRKEEPNLTEEELYFRSYKDAMLFFEKCNESDNESADDQNPLPSPRPSNGEASESDEWEFPTVDSIRARQSTPKISKLFSRQRLRKRDTIPPQRNRRQPRKKGKDENKRNKPRDKALPPAVETFLSSKRSSRRDHNCKLWQLDDDGTTCTVSRAR